MRVTELDRVFDVGYEPARQWIERQVFDGVFKATVDGRALADRLENMPQAGDASAAETAPKACEQDRGSLHV